MLFHFLADSDVTGIVSMLHSPWWWVILKSFSHLVCPALSFVHSLRSALHSKPGLNCSLYYNRWRSENYVLYLPYYLCLCCLFACLYDFKQDWIKHKKQFFWNLSAGCCVGIPELIWVTKWFHQIWITFTNAARIFVLNNVILLKAH